MPVAYCSMVKTIETFLFATSVSVYLHSDYLQHDF